MRPEEEELCDFVLFTVYIGLFETLFHLYKYKCNNVA